jgi:hypothetical protein
MVLVEVNLQQILIGTEVDSSLQEAKDNFQQVIKYEIEETVAVMVINSITKDYDPNKDQ